MDQNSTPTSENLDNALSHCIASYANAQEVIRFLDTKSGILTGLITATAAFLVAALNWLYTPSDAPNCTWKSALIAHPFLFRCVIVLLLLSVVAAIFSVIFSVLSVSARGPKGATTILFPVTPANNTLGLDELLNGAKNGLTKEYRIFEYSQQIHTIGGILCSKMAYLRKATWGYLCQLVTIFGAIFLALLSDIIR